MSYTDYTNKSPEKYECLEGFLNAILEDFIKNSEAALHLTRSEYEELISLHERDIYCQTREAARTLDVPEEVIDSFEC